MIGIAVLLAANIVAVGLGIYANSQTPAER